MLVQCPVQLMDKVGQPFECDLPSGHEGEHVCYVGDGESCDTSQPEPDEEDPDASYITETVEWSVRWKVRSKESCPVCPGLRAVRAAPTDTSDIERRENARLQWLLRKEEIP